jgi:hypothetical protein
MAKARFGEMAIPKFSSESSEAVWWDARHREIDIDIHAKLKDLAERTATDINERAARMTPGRRALADLITRKIAAQVQRRTP